MPSQASKGIGTTISKGGVLVGTLTEIKGIDMSADTLDVTTLDTAGGYRQNIAGWKDGGEVSVSGFFVPGDAGQSALISGFDAGTEDTFIITFPSSIGATWTFQGIVTKITTGVGLEDPVSFEATVKVNGKPVLGTTPSAGLTALVLSGGGTLTPTVSATTYSYSYVFTTATSITVTPTASNHTIKMYVDDVYVQDITSASASNAIAGFTAQSGKIITLVCYESGKSPKNYTIACIRTT